MMSLSAKSELAVNFYDELQQKRREKIKLNTARLRCESEHLFFTRYFFLQRQALRFRVNWHHIVMADAIEKVIKGEIENLVVNVPPGSSKTELFVISLIARGLAINPRARFLHLSGSDQLALLNSQTARELVTSDHFQAFWPLKISDDANSKKRWNIEINGQPAGGVYATSIGGQVTGFRAGHMTDGFQGAIIIDDPNKPEDAYSKSKLNLANRKLISTVKSRRANPKTPIVVVMQRVSENDATAFIESGHIGGKWTVVKIPAMLTEEQARAIAPNLFDRVDTTEKDEHGRFSYWPYKEPLQELAKMERGEGTDSEGKRISRFVYASQYDQKPRALGGNLIRGEWFHRYKILPKIVYRKIYADTAQKTKTHNDFSVFEEWGLAADGRGYLIDMIRGKWESPELKRRATAFWAKAKARDVETFGQLRAMPVEDKSSGTDLIQTLKLPPYNIPVQEIQRGTDKLTRVMDAQPYIEVGLCSVPEDAPFTNDFVTECEAFTADGSHAHDDQIDPLLDMVMDMLSSGNKLKIWELLGKQAAAEKDQRTKGKQQHVEKEPEQTEEPGEKTDEQSPPSSPQPVRQIQPGQKILDKIRAKIEAQ